MQVIDGSLLGELAAKLDQLRVTLPVSGTVSPVPIPIPVKVHPPVVTTLMRGTATIGYVITPFGSPSPIAIGVKLQSGTLWVEAALFGSAFGSTPGYVGVPFASADMKASGSVTFGSGNIVLDAAATLTFTVTSSVSPATGSSGDPVGQDFLEGKLTPFPGAIVSLAPAAPSIAVTGASSATLYGQSLSFSPAASPTIGLVVNTAPYLALSCSVAQKMFAVSQSASPEVLMAGKAPVTGAGVVFPILNATAPLSLPDPTDAWGDVVVTGPGLSATVAPLTTPFPFPGSSFALTPAKLMGLVAWGPARARETYTLWTSPPPPSPLPPIQPDLPLPVSQITLDLATGSLVFFAASPTQEVTIASGIFTGILDRPLDAGGQRLNLQGPGTFARVHSASSITVTAGSTLNPTANTTIALVAENAVIPAFTPNGILVSGTLTAGAISAGGLAIGFPGATVVPTFPDPYAAAYVVSAQSEAIAAVTAQVVWTAKAAPVVGMVIQEEPAAGAAPKPAATTASTATIGPAAGPAFFLLDVSTNADQWGIALDTGAPPQLSFSGLVLQAPAGDTNVFTMCGISWEPIVAGGSVPTWLAVFSPDDGVPTTFLVAVTKPAPIIPVTALEQYQAAAGTVTTTATFTLPFGIYANLADQGKSGGPSYTIPAIQFPAENLAAARVLSITGAPAPALQANLPGTALSGYATGQYGAKVLNAGKNSGLSVAEFWDQNFGPPPVGKGYMPVTRVDLSGYGTTLRLRISASFARSSTCCSAAPRTRSSPRKPGSCPGASGCSARSRSTGPTAARLSSMTLAGRRSRPEPLSSSRPGRCCSYPLPSTR
jgi:hypothetical protein